ncbi:MULTISPECIES: hypothetical protein [Mesobacillus]|uniref:hypothetical protein n=1 Tax=Mesobacillus TaxID=2675231 RepID=UPI0017807F99|nr:MULTISPECIES: hypothetical protein [Mesobacillus]MCM3576383.1 hypothetical protein [Mesobacillus subterraneus]UYZ22481.1 hypothetical protein FOF60_02510 [Mesobacillus jeotgali]
MLLVWVLIALLIIFTIFMPKRLTVKENIIMFPIIGYFAWTAHTVFGMMLDFVDFGPTKKVELTDWALVTFIPPLLGILFLNFKTSKYMIYVVIWTISSFLIELLLDIFGYMKHSEWIIWYSIPTYLLAYFSLHWFFQRVIRSL